MKILFLSFFLFCTLSTFAQFESPEKPRTGAQIWRQELLHQARQQRKIGTAFCVSGGVISVTGLIVLVSQYSFHNSNAHAESTENIGSAMAIGGAFLLVTGFAIIISANPIEKKARLLLSTPSIQTPTSSSKKILSLSFAINL